MRTDPIRAAIRKAHETGKRAALDQVFAALGRTLAGHVFPSLTTIAPIEPVPVVTKAIDRDHGKPSDPDLESDPHSALLLAQLDHRIRCHETGENPDEGDRALHALWHDPDALAHVLMPHVHDADTGFQKAIAFALFRKSWDESRHPRDDSGEFVSQVDIRGAKRSDARADAIRAKVTDPAERKKLDAAILSANPVGGVDRAKGRDEIFPDDFPLRHGPQYIDQEGVEHALVVRGHMVNAIKSARGVGKAGFEKVRQEIGDIESRSTKNATVHWHEAKKKALAQFKSDFPDFADQEVVSKAFDDASRLIQRAYETMATKASEYALLLATGSEADLDLNERDYRDEFNDAYHDISREYSKQFDAVRAVVKEYRDWHGGDEKGYKLNRYFKAVDSAEFEKAAEHAPKGGISLKGTFYPGGRWIPATVVASASPEEKRELAERKSGARPNPLSEREQKRADNLEKKGGRDALRKKVADIASDIMLHPHDRTPDKYRDLAEAIDGEHLTVADLRGLRTKLSASFGGGRRKEQMVAALLKHAQDAHEAARNEVAAVKDEPVPESPAAEQSQQPEDQLPTSDSEPDSTDASATSSPNEPPSASAGGGAGEGHALPLHELASHAHDPAKLGAEAARHADLARKQPGEGGSLALHDAMTAGLRGEHGPAVRDAVSRGLSDWGSHGGDLAKKYARVAEEVAKSGAVPKAKAEQQAEAVGTATPNGPSKLDQATAAPVDNPSATAYNTDVPATQSVAPEGKPVAAKPNPDSLGEKAPTEPTVPAQPRTPRGVGIGADDANPTDEEFEAASRPAKPKAAKVAPQPAIPSPNETSPAPAPVTPSRPASKDAKPTKRTDKKAVGAGSSQSPEPPKDLNAVAKDASEFGQAGAAHPVKGETKFDAAKKLGSLAFTHTSGGESAYDAIGAFKAGPPPGLDMKQFASDVRGVVGRHAEAVGGIGPAIHDAYESVGAKYGLSKYDFLRGVAAMIDSGDLKPSVWSKAVHELPDPHLALPRFSKIMAYIHPPAGTDSANMAKEGDVTLNTSHPSVRAKYGSTAGAKPGPNAGKPS